MIRSRLGSAGAANPACRLDKSTVGPGDGVGPAALDTGGGLNLTHRVVFQCFGS